MKRAVRLCDEGGREKTDHAPARRGCSHPWIPSPLPLWQKRRLEVWSPICVNKLCQVWAQPAAQTQPHPEHTLNLYQLLCLGLCLRAPMDLIAQ